MSKPHFLHPVAIWAAPVAIAMVTAVGLALALLFEGVVAKTSACLALATPLGVILYCCARPIWRRQTDR